MAFPSSPINNQTAVVNGIDYVYNSTKGAWKRVPVVISGADPYARDTANAAFLQANSATSYSQSAGSYANSAFDKANSVVQTGFTTISANGVSITPSSNADTYYIAAGSNITIDANATTKTITIASTASGGGGGGTITFNVAPPDTGNTIGDRWIDSNDGTQYTYVSDGTSTQWIDLTTPAFNLNNLIGGTTGSIPWQSAANTTSFLDIGTPNQIMVSNGTIPTWSSTISVNSATISGSATISANTQTASLGVGTAASGTTGEIRATNLITAYYSDERLKTRLGNIENPIQKLMSLNGFYYEANETAQKLGYEKKREVGVSAQEVQNVLPEVIAAAPIDDKYLTVHYERIIPLLIESIKEQQKQIEELKSIINGNN